MSKTFSGKQIVAFLEKNYSFAIIGQKGSHVKLRSTISGQKTRTVIVPLHRELATGTLRGILEQAGLDFSSLLKNN